MTQLKKLKKTIRARSRKTGERVTLKADGNARLRYRWDGTTVEIHIIGKPKGGATVVAVNSKLADASQVERRRAQWRQALEALKAHVAR